jgi:predicted metal-dependent peptidase
MATLKKGKDPAEEVSRSILAMLLKEPFFAHLLGGIPRRICDDVPTAAVALTPRGVELIVNPIFFLEELNERERVAVIKHEALHLVYRHLYRPLISQGFPEIFNIAADLVVNQYVSPWPLPESAVTLNLFPDLNLEPNQTVEWYYEKLISLDKELRNKTASQTSAPQSAEALQKINGPQRHSDHRFWAAHGGHGFEATASANESGATPQLTDLLRTALESDLERHLIRAKDRTSIQQWGVLPSDIRLAITEMQARREGGLDWRRTLKLFASGGYRTKVVPTSRKLSKRFGTFPGIKIKRLQNLAVVLDTSGSIEELTLSKFFREIHAVWKTGADITIIESDSTVQQTYTYRGKVPVAAKGGGGTLFDPAFVWLRQAKAIRFDACLYLTDGFGPETTVRPPCPLLWLVTSKSGMGSHLKWGRSIFLDLDL